MKPSPIYELNCEMLIKRPLAEVFPFFEDARNLAQITPAWLHFEILSKDQIVMRPEAEIDYRIRLMGIPMNWKTIIVRYEPPHCFVDEQASGPYRLWRHTHTFRAVPEGTLASDRVEYSLPFGPIGRLAHFVTVQHQLRAIFSYRQRALSKVFEEHTKPLRNPTIALKPL